MGIRLENIFFVVIFFLLIFAMVIETNYTSEISELENRALAPFPDVNPFHDKFPTKLDAYINDRVGFKLEALNISRVVLPIGARVNLKSRAIMGKDNWLFYNDEGETFKEFQRTDRLAEKELENIKTIFTEVDEFTKNNNIKLYIVVPPMKHNVYGEFYSARLKQLHLPSWYETVLEYTKDCDIPLIDLLKPLIDNKNEKELYYLSDTHWNYDGAYIGYKTLMDEIAKSFPNIHIYKPEDFDIVKVALKSYGDLANMVRIYHEEYVEQMEKKIIPKNDLGIKYQKTTSTDTAITKNNDNNSPSIFILHDSFLFFQPYLRNSFSKSYSVLDRGASPLKYKKDILREKPNILVWEIQERYLRPLAK